MIRIIFSKSAGYPSTLCGDIVRSSLFQAFRLWGRQKGTRGPVIIYRRGEDFGLNKVNLVDPPFECYFTEVIPLNIF